MNRTQRLDLLVMERFGCSRSYAGEVIESRLVSVGGKVISKPGKAIDETAEVKLIGDAAPRYVSRGGYKLEKALDVFHVDTADKVCLDVGASTGGFTHCLLEAGARRVYAIDSGSGQLSPVLRNDPRVISMEKTNIRYIDVLSLQEAAIAVVDVSFVSLTKVLEPVIAALLPEGELICLIKPQFEAGRQALNKKGVVKDRRIHEKVILDIVSFVKKVGVTPSGLIFSPVRGPEGNMEYLLYVNKMKTFNEEINFETLTYNVVNEAHLYFTGGEE